MPQNGLRIGHFVVPMSQLPRRPVPHKSLHKSSMHRMPRPLRHHPALDPPPRQRQIPYQIQHFMPNKLILKPKWPIFNTLPRQNNRAIPRSPPNQPHIPQHLFIFLKPKRPRRSNQTHVIANRQVTRKPFHTNRLRKINLILDPVPRPWIHPNKLRSLANFNFLQDLQVFPLPSLLLKPHRMKGLHIGQRTSIQNRNLKVIHLNYNVINTIPDQRR